MRKGMRNTVIFTPLKGKSFQVSTAGHGVVGRSPQWADGEVIKKSFQGAPMFVTSMIGFHDPKFSWSICEWVSDFPKFNGMNNFFMRYSSSFSRKVSV